MLRGVQDHLLHCCWVWFAMSHVVWSKLCNQIGAMEWTDTCAVPCITLLWLDSYKQKRPGEVLVV